MLHKATIWKRILWKNIDFLTFMFFFLFFFCILLMLKAMLKHLYSFVMCCLIHLIVGSGKTGGTAQDPDSLHPIHCTLINKALTIDPHPKIYQTSY